MEQSPDGPQTVRLVMQAF